MRIPLWALLVAIVLVILGIGYAIWSFGMTDAYRGQVKALGSKHKIELFSGGVMVRDWTTTGKPSSESHSDGWYFVDDKTGLLVRVSGTVVVTQQ